jgi:hypothetical protein
MNLLQHNGSAGECQALELLQLLQLARQLWLNFKAAFMFHAVLL